MSKEVSKKFINEVEAILQVGEEVEVAMMMGNYKKVNELMDFLEEEKKKAEIAIATKKDIMVA